MQPKFSRVTGFAMAASLAVLLAACTPSAQAEIQAQADTYIRSHIEELSPRAASVGGHFSVDTVTWIDSDTAEVTYDDGHKQYQGTFDIKIDENDTITVTKVQLHTSSSSASMLSSSLSSSSSDDENENDEDRNEDEDGGEHASSQSNSGSGVSISARAQAKMGEFCGGIAGIACVPGLTCDYAGTYADAGGTCK